MPKTIRPRRLPLCSTTEQGAVPAMGASSGRFLKDDITWSAVGGGSVNIKQTEVDMGASVGTKAKSFTITDADVSAGSQLMAFQALDAPTGKSQDENEMDTLICKCAPGTGQFTLLVESITGSVVGNFKINYLVG